MYYAWFDDSPRTTPRDKILEAVAAYIARFHATPNVALVNAEDMTEVPGLSVRAESYIRRHTFWIGREENPTSSHT